MAVAILSMIASVGAAVLALLRDIGAVAVFAARGAAAIFQPPYFFREVLHQLLRIGYYSLPVVGMTALFTGAVLALQIYIGGSRFNAESAVASIVAIGIARELGPVLAGLMVAGRVSAAIAAEIGTMRVTEQIDAMAVMAVNPVQYLVMPRVLATMLMMPLLVMLFNLVAILAAYALSVGYMNIDPGIFVQKIRDFVEAKDVIFSAIKGASFGLAIGLVGCYKGYYASGGAKGVGEATTSSVVTSSIAVLFLDYILTVFMYN